MLAIWAMQMCPQEQPKELSHETTATNLIPEGH